MTDMHTPGPWSINSWPQATSDISIGASGTPCIARVPLRDVSINEQRANAAVIAAADDMLEALRSLLESITNSECGEVDRKLAVKDAREAIAKATGQTP